MDCSPLLVCNKTDLKFDGLFEAALDEYDRLGYPVVRTCAAPDSNVAELARLLTGHTSILVGQTGVGKSSLINALVGDRSAAVDTLSKVSAEGKHTTSVSVMHRLTDGARLIDSPGVREFVPNISVWRGAARVSGNRGDGRQLSFCELPAPAGTRLRCQTSLC